MGGIPNRQKIGGVVCWDGSNNPHTQQVSKFVKKKFEKKFGEYKIYVLPLAGWVGMSI
jgi:hypothetical protein